MIQFYQAVERNNELEQTYKERFSFFKGIMRAATHDDINPIGGDASFSESSDGVEEKKIEEIFGCGKMLKR